MAEIPIEEISIRDFNQNISRTLGAVAGGRHHAVTHGRGPSRRPYVTLIASDLVDQLVELAGEQGKLLLTTAAADPGTQLEVIRVA